MICARSLTDVVNRDIDWLWKPFIPYGKITLVQGDTGIGKTSLMIKLLADLSNGIYPPTMYRRRLVPQKHDIPVKSYYVTVENGMDDTIAPLFDLFRGKRNYVQFQDETVGHFVLTGDEICSCVEQTGARVIIVDPWQQFMNNNASPSDNIALRKMICDVQTAAEKTGAAVILAGNFTKNLGADIRRGIGGSELNNTLRSILTIQDDPDGDASIRILRATKMSLLGKEMTPVIIRQDENYGLSFESYDAIADAQPEMEISCSKNIDPVSFLKEILKDGPLDRNEIKKRANEDGITMSRIYRAREGAGVAIVRNGNKSSLWKLEN